MKLTKLQRTQLKQMFNGRCTYCGELLSEKWHADHLQAIRRNGDGTCENPEHDCIENLVPACTACNHNKRSMSLEAWRDLLAHYRDVQVIRDCAQVRHLMRFGLIEFVKKPVVFYFETIRGTSV
ncbi:HNH endonuclease [Acinetobacter defluvii]|uniref:HNH endonuclease n=1 Tax=Acinetobacter defluvii TaxID=1871111 RepID=UPI00148F59AB|nr:HNH endonuclease [Acinetobacter defluvii]NNP72085.1 HNH endonuclease [Acinetobacter defluvii]